MSSHPEITFDRYLTYDDLTGHLQALAEKYPELITLDSIGKSYEGRDVWAVTVTNKETGPAEEKPALYCDGNIHAGEVTPSMILLYAVDFLTRQFSENEEVTRLLNDKAFYLLPRVNPDGAEKYLTTPYLLRSSVRPYPDGVQELPGLHPCDIDGDGKILTMRVRDDKRGQWRPSNKDPRVMVPRRPAEYGGPFYHLYKEGELRGTDSEPFEEQSVPWGLDLNRNFPSNWTTDTKGAGDYPTSEPEAKNIIDFMISHNNIGGMQAIHTYGGFFYRNPYQYPEEDMNEEDLKATIEIAREGETVTGYTDEKSDNCSTLTEWAYEHRGILGYTTEVWDRWDRAGIDREKYRAAEDPELLEGYECRLLQWNDRELAGRGFHQWRAFEHPQLGKVELGGWDPKFAVQNPPPELLEQECYKNTRWIIRQAGALPRLRIEETDVSLEADNIYRIEALIGNHGYLPTAASQKAKELDVVQPDEAELQASDEVGILSGDPCQELGFLDGFISGQSKWGTGSAESSQNAIWVVSAPDNAEITVIARSERAGIDERNIDLKEATDKT